MADPIYHNGSDGKAFIQNTGSPTPTPIELPVTKWDLTISGNNQDVSNAKDGRYRIGGVPDAKGSLDMHWDSANNLADDTALTGANVRAGSVIHLELVPDGGDAGTDESFRLDAIIDDVKPTSDFNGTIDFNTTFSLQKGSTLKYPGDS